MCDVSVRCMNSLGGMFLLKKQQLFFLGSTQNVERDIIQNTNGQEQQHKFKRTTLRQYNGRSWEHSQVGRITWRGPATYDWYDYRYSNVISDLNCFGWNHCLGHLSVIYLISWYFVAFLYAENCLAELLNVELKRSKWPWLCLSQVAE